MLLFRRSLGWAHGALQEGWDVIGEATCTAAVVAIIATARAAICVVRTRLLGAAGFTRFARGWSALLAFAGLLGGRAVVLPRFWTRVLWTGILTGFCAGLRLVAAVVACLIAAFARSLAAALIAAFASCLVAAFAAGGGGATGADALRTAIL